MKRRGWLPLVGSCCAIVIVENQVKVKGVCRHGISQVFGLSMDRESARFLAHLHHRHVHQHCHQHCNPVSAYIVENRQSYAASERWREHHSFATIAMSRHMQQVGSSWGLLIETCKRMGTECSSGRLRVQGLGSCCARTRAMAKYGQGRSRATSTALEYLL